MSSGDRLRLCNKCVVLSKYSSLASTQTLTAMGSCTQTVLDSAHVMITAHKEKKKKKTFGSKVVIIWKQGSLQPCSPNYINTWFSLQHCSRYTLHEVSHQRTSPVTVKFRDLTQVSFTYSSQHCDVRVRRIIAYTLLNLIKGYFGLSVLHLTSRNSSHKLSLQEWFSIAITIINLQMPRHEFLMDLIKK